MCMNKIIRIHLLSERCGRRRWRSTCIGCGWTNERPNEKKKILCVQMLAIYFCLSLSLPIYLPRLLDKCTNSPSTHNKQSHLVFAADKYSNDFNTVGFVVIGVVRTTVHVTQCGMFNVMLHVINTTYLHTRNKKQQSIDNDNDLSLNCIPKIACKSKQIAPKRHEKKSRKPNRWLFV